MIPKMFVCSDSSSGENLIGHQYRGALEALKKKVFNLLKILYFLYFNNISTLTK